MKARVLLDVDGVLADFTSALLDVVRNVTGKRYLPHHVTHFDFVTSLGLTIAEGSAVKNWIGDSRGWCQSLPVYPGARAGVEKLLEVTDLYIVTSPWNSCETWTWEREQWLRDNFAIPASRVIHGSAKHVCHADFLVDDKTTTLEKWRDHNPAGQAIQWATMHNRRDHWTGIGVSSWEALLAEVTH